MSSFFHSSEVVLLYYFLWYDVEWKADILITFHGGDQIKIIDVEAHEARLWSWNITVEA